MTAPFPMSSPDAIAPGGAYEGAPAAGASAHEERAARASFLDDLGRAMAPAGAAERASPASPASPGSPPAASAAASAAAASAAAASAATTATLASAATTATLAAALLQLEEQPNRPRSTQADEARSKLERARSSRQRRRAGRAEDDERAAQTADKAVGDALALAAPGSQQQQPRKPPSVEAAAPARSSSAGAIRATGEAEGARAIDATSRRELHVRHAAARANAVKSALDAAGALAQTAAPGREHAAVHAPDRRAPEGEKRGAGRGEKERETAKPEAGPTPSRLEATLPPPPDAGAASLRGPSPASSGGASASPPLSASEGPHAALPPSPGQDVQGALLPHAAHLKIEAGAMGEIELHLRVREGALHLRVEGDAARAVEARAGELSRALAAEGLKLAPIEATPGDAMSRDAGTAQGGGGRAFEERREAWDEAAEAGERAPAAPPPRAPQPRTGARTSGIHVKA